MGQIVGVVSQRVLVCCWLAAISVVKLNLNFINRPHMKANGLFFLETPLTVAVPLPVIVDLLL